MQNINTSYFEARKNKNVSFPKGISSKYSPWPRLILIPNIVVFLPQNFHESFLFFYKRGFPPNIPQAESLFIGHCEGEVCDDDDSFKKNDSNHSDGEYDHYH